MALMKPQRMWCARAALGVACAVVGLGAPAALAQDDYIERVNAFYANISREARSDLVVLPAVGSMAAPPIGVETISKAAMLPTTSALWPAAEAWAQEPEQRAVLDALEQVTQEPDYRYAMAFGQPYGVEALVSSDEELSFIAQGLYTELDLGGTPTLAAADFRYLDGLKQAFCLVQVEASRLAKAGDVPGALKVLTNGLFFARQIADREFAKEKRFGMQVMMLTLERMRDVVFMDSHGAKSLANNSQALIPILDRIAETTREGGKGYIGVDRINFPRADRVAAEQLCEQVLLPNADVSSSMLGANPETFVPTMARLSAGNRPMRLFSEMPRWEMVTRVGQAPRAAAMSALRAIYDDMEVRWNRRNPWDAIMRQPLEIRRRRLGNLVAVGQVVRGLPDLFSLWQALRLEAVGTRHALALAGYALRNGAMPPNETAVRPLWLQQMESDPLVDPLQGGTGRGAAANLRYFVPERDTQGQPHEINVVTPGAPNFRKRLRRDDFVLYSVGTDSQAGWAREVQNTMDPVLGADYLIWPPVMSLLREEQVRTGQLR
ncbi:MAG: hypothetical protein H6811_11790 [Phycisphaeraceae bacterium]|nr:hypothetical protein [Phycisphaeraceae bacterium]